MPPAGGKNHNCLCGRCLLWILNPAITCLVGSVDGAYGSIEGRVKKKRKAGHADATQRNDSTHPSSRMECFAYILRPWTDEPSVCDQIATILCSQAKPHPAQPYFRESHVTQLFDGLPEFRLWHVATLRCFTFFPLNGVRGGGPIKPNAFASHEVGVRVPCFISQTNGSTAGWSLTGSNVIRTCLPS